jgi:cobyrinic acid a,c-diamide synthase
MNAPGLMISAPASGTGKTTVMLGLLRAFADMGRRGKRGRDGRDMASGTGKTPVMPGLLRAFAAMGRRGKRGPDGRDTASGASGVAQCALSAPDCDHRFRPHSGASIYKDSRV